MRGRKLIIPALALLVVPSAAAVTIGVTAITRSGVQDSWSDIAIDEQYSFHDTLTISERTFTKGGNSYTSSHLLTFPNGKKTDSSEVLLDQVGNYSLIYTSIVDGKVFTSVKKFNVKYGAFYFDSTKSSAAYISEGPEAKVYDAMTQTEADAQLVKGAAGLMVNLAKDDAFHITRHFDVSNVTKNDALVKGYIVPTTQGASDFTTLTFKFTDSKDPSTFLRCSYFAYQVNSQGGWSFAGAGGNGQQICGWLASQNAVYRGEGTGASMQTSFAAYRYDTLGGNTSKYLKYDQNPFQVSFDSNEMAVYGEGNKIICDLDSSVYFEKFWSGFPSGKADLTITADGYSGNSGTIVLTNILGYEKLSEFEFEDTNGPEITLDCEYDNLPNGLTNIPYSIPKASAFDDYSRECKVRTEVVYNFAGENPVNISIENGTFTPKKMGPYAIRYVSCDESNNETVLTKVINVYDELADISFNLPNNKLSAAQVGQKVQIDAPTNITGGSGNKTFAVNASIGDKIVPITENSFIPDEIGEWTITYSVIDYLNQVKTQSYNINVTMDNEYALKGNLELLNYYISGTQYVLPEVELFHKVNDKVNVEVADIRVTDFNGINSIKSGSIFTPKVENNGDTINMRIQIDGQILFDQTVKGIVPFEVITQGTAQRSILNITNYFEFDSCTSNIDEALTDEGIKITTSGTNGSVKFVKPINKEKAEIAINKISSRGTSAEMDIKLIDSYDSSKTVTIKAVTEDMQLLYKYGDASVVAENTFMNPAASEIKFAFDNKNISIGSFTNKVNYFDNGLPFTGFKNDVYFEISFKSFEENDYFFLQKINNHEINKNKADKFAPEIIVTESYELEHEYNELFKVPFAYAKDVLSPNVNLKLTVKTKDGIILKSTDGKELNEIALDEDIYLHLTAYGDYKITYTASETTDFIKSPNKKDYTITISVVDKKVPVLTITSKYQSEVNVGEYIVIPSYTVVDNVTPLEKIIRVVSVAAPDGKKYYLDATTDEDRNIDPLTGKAVPVVNGFKVTQKGKHIVRILVSDESGNSASFTYEVEAK